MQLFLNCTVFLSVCQLTQLVQVLPRIHIPQFGIVPGGHKADGTGVGPRNGIAAAAIRQVKQLRKIIRAEQHWAATVSYTHLTLPTILRV